MLVRAITRVQLDGADTALGAARISNARPGSLCSTELTWPFVTAGLVNAVATFSLNRTLSTSQTPVIRSGWKVVDVNAMPTFLPAHGSLALTIGIVASKSRK